MRAIWKGAVSFGLVNVPVRLYSATENHDVQSRQVHREGWGSRPVPPVIGHPALSAHLVSSLVDDEFDITVAQELEVDHGLTVPLSVYCPEPGDAWPCLSS